MKISLGALVPALVLSSLVGVLTELSINADLVVAPETGFLFWINVISYVGFIVNPLLVFAIFFLTGKRIDIVNNLVPVTFSLFLGVLVGFWIGFAPEVYFMTHFYGGLEQNMVLGQLSSYVITGSFPLLFFAGFSAIWVASIVKMTRKS